MKIEIIPYDQKWPAEFRAIAQQIRTAVGESALAIHHIGSTSVPGLCAKDIIDIQMAVADFSPRWKVPLENLGFEYREYLRDHCPAGMQLAADQLEKRMFSMTSRAINLHLRVQGRFNQRYALLFRDYLRIHPMAANAYGEIKSQLAHYFPLDMDAYYAIKDPVCDCIMSGALDWAAANNWQPGPSDA